MMLKNQITDIFFDLDHTLWDFETNSKAALQKLINKHNLPISINDFSKVYDPINKQYWDDYAKQLKTKEQVKFERFSKTFEALNISVAQEFINIFADGYLTFLKQENALMPGSLEILDYLKDKYRLHILTNGFREVQQEKLDNAGIITYIDLLITSEETGKLKPHPQTFNYALKKANTVAHRSYMIGDNLQYDVLGARNVGMSAIHYDPLEESNIDFSIIPKVKHLIDIKEIL